MDPTAVLERVERVATVRADVAADADTIGTALVALCEITAWADAQRAALAGRLADHDSFPEQRIAAAARSSLGEATKVTERAGTLGAAPALSNALDDGAITASHIDVLTRAARQVDQAHRQDLLERVDALVDVAAAATVGEFDRRVRLEAKRLQSDDGMDRLERQRRAVRLRSWTDADGMWNLRGRFDPVTGVRLASALDQNLQALFAEHTPAGCPDDPIEKQQFLAAHTLRRLLTERSDEPDELGARSSAGDRPGRPEFLVVIDADAESHTGPAAEWPIPVEIPARVLAELADTADIHEVVVRNGVVLHAPGRLDLGRTTRLANRAQRRALRGLYRHCAIPGCEVTFERCKIHHVIWWRHGGHTDLANLLPVCSHHHTKIHHHGWIVELGPNRELTLRLPDGTIRTTGPPGRRTAA